MAGNRAAGICPGNNESAGKPHDRPNDGRQSPAAQRAGRVRVGSGYKNGCFLKEKFGRVQTKHEGKNPPSIMAVAHILLILIYKVLLP